MNLLKPLVTISFVTSVSRILGYIRDTLIARIFGAGEATDAFFIAFRLPNLLRKIFAEGAFSQAFIPILVELKNKQNDNYTRIFIAHVAGLLIFILFIITILGILTAPYIIYVTAPGFVNYIDKFELTVYLLRIIFPYILLISLVSLCGAILNTWGYFFVPAFVPALLNFSIIIFLLFLAPYCDPPIIALGFGIILGGVLQLAYQLPYLYKIGMLTLPLLSFYNNEIWKLLRLMSPALLAVSLNQFSLVINTIFASFLESGTVSCMYYADRLMEFPVSILGVSLGTILLPILSKQFSTGRYENFQKIMDSGLRLCFLLSLPFTFALVILAKPLIITLFQYGNFTSYDSVMTEQILIAYCIGLIGLILVKILVTAFYSKKDLKTPVKIACITLILTQIMNIVFIGPLKHVGLALSVSLGSYVNAIVLYYQLRRKLNFVPLSGWNVFFKKIFLSLLVMISILLILMSFITDWEIISMYNRMIRLILISFIGLIVYFSMLFVLGMRLDKFF